MSWHSDVQSQGRAAHESFAGQVVTYVAPPGYLGLNGATDRRFPGVTAIVGPIEQEPLFDGAQRVLDRERRISLFVRQAINAVDVTLPLLESGVFEVDGEAWAIQRIDSYAHGFGVYICKSRPVTRVSALQSSTQTTRQF